MTRRTMGSRHPLIARDRKARRRGARNLAVPACVPPCFRRLRGFELLTGGPKRSLQEVRHEVSDPGMRPRGNRRGEGGPGEGQEGRDRRGDRGAGSPVPEAAADRTAHGSRRDLGDRGSPGAGPGGPGDTGPSRAKSGEDRRQREPGDLFRRRRGDVRRPAGRHRGETGDPAGLGEGSIRPSFRSTPSRTPCGSRTGSRVPGRSSFMDRGSWAS